MSLDALREGVAVEFDFTTIMERSGHDALALDAIGSPGGFAPAAPRDGFDVIPLWVADMSFPTCPSVIRALSARIEHPAFGYFAPREEYFASIIDWHRVRNGVSDMEPEHIGYENGVLGGVVSALRSFAAPGDPVLVHSPTYIGFTKSLAANGFPIVHSPLYLDEDGVWRMDFEDMERKLEEHSIHAAVFCSPHNPCGRVWERAEIERAMEIYAAHDCVVISDEIWSDIVRPGFAHIPTQSVSDDARRRTVALYAPSKTFSLAGLVGSYHVVYDDYLRDRVRAQADKSRYNEMNVLSMHALIGAYTEEGARWTDEMRQVIAGNVDAVMDALGSRFEGVSAALPQGTYMLFLDCAQWCAEHGKTIEDVERAAWDVGVAVQDGRMFGGPAHVRMNVALPKSRVVEALERLDKFVFNA